MRSAPNSKLIILALCGGEEVVNNAIENRKTGVPEILDCFGYWQTLLKIKQPKIFWIKRQEKDRMQNQTQ